MMAALEERTRMLAHRIVSLALGLLLLVACGESSGESEVTGLWTGTQSQRVRVACGTFDGKRFSRDGTIGLCLQQTGVSVAGQVSGSIDKGISGQLSGTTLTLAAGATRMSSTISRRCCSDTTVIRSVPRPTIHSTTRTSRLATRPK